MNDDTFNKELELFKLLEDIEGQLKDVVNKTATAAHLCMVLDHPTRAGRLYSVEDMARHLKYFIESQKKLSVILSTKIMKDN